MPSTIDLVINASVTGLASIGQLRTEVASLTDAARQNIRKENGDLVTSRDIFENIANKQAEKLAMQDLYLGMTKEENVYLAIQRETMMKNQEMLNRKVELSNLALEIAKDENITYLEALNMAEEELTIRELIAESMASVSAGVGMRPVSEQNLVGTGFEKLYAEAYPQIEAGNYTLEESFNILAASMERINFEGQQTNVMFRNMVSSQEKAIISNEQMLNMGAEQRVALGGMNAKLEEQNIQLGLVKNSALDWNKINTEAYHLTQSNNLSAEEAIRIATERAVAHQNEIALQAAENKKIEENTALLGKKRMELMQMSIGMFVLGITTTQTFTALSNMVGATTEAGMVFKELGNSFKLLLGPMQVFLALQQLITMQNKQMLLSALPFMFALGSIYLLWKAFTSDSPKIRAALGAIGGAMAVLTALTIKQSMANYANAISSLTKWVAKLGPAGIGYLPLGLALIGGAIAGGIALAATAPKAQTIPGYARPIHDTGWFYGHRGEFVGRIGNMSPTSTTSNNVNVNIVVQSGASLDRGMIPQLSREIQLAVASGNGV